MKCSREGVTRLRVIQSVQMKGKFLGSTVSPREDRNAEKSYWTEFLSRDVGNKSFQVIGVYSSTS